MENKMFVSKAKYEELERNFSKALKALAICGGRLRLERSFKDSWKDKYYNLQSRYVAMRNEVKSAIDEKNPEAKLAENHA